ncbi:MAG: hypothetical protein GY716_13990 [bacterium]|nr:hypothetical protein [bacterium]
MTDAGDSLAPEPGSPSARPHPFHLIPLCALALIGVLPPETRGESLAGVALLLAALALLTARESFAQARSVGLVVVAVCALPLLLVARAPGALVEPLAMVLLALSAGLATAALPRARRGSWIVWPLAGAAGLAGLHACYQKLWGLERLADAVRAGTPVAEQAAVLARLESGRAFAAFPTPAALGGYLAFCLPPTIGAAIGATGRRRALWLALAACQLGGMLAAASATAVAALLVAGGLAASVWKAGGRRIVVALAAVVVVLVAIVALRGGEVSALSHPNSPWRLRAQNYELAAQVIRDHPWTGVGPGGFGEVYPQYRRPGHNETRHVHDLPLELCAELGLPAGAWVSLLFFVVFLGPLFRREAGEAAWRSGLRIGLAGFAVHNVGDFTAFLPSLLWTACLARGWLARESVVPQAASARSGRVWAAAGATLVAAVLAAAGGLAWNTRTAARANLAAGNLEAASALATRAARIAPWNVDGHLLRGRAGLGSAPTRERATELLPAVERALELSPVRPGAYDLRARLRLSRGDLPGAYTDARRAATLYPLRVEYAEFANRLASALESQARP